jgi:hypothetical protein
MLIVILNTITLTLNEVLMADTNIELMAVSNSPAK